MAAFRMSLGSGDVQDRVTAHLTGAAQDRRVVWQDGADEVYVHADTLALTIVDGWLVAGVDLEADAIGRSQIRAVLFLGSAGEGDGPRAGATIDPECHPTLAERWGQPVITAVWNAILDVIEDAVTYSAAQAATNVTLLGFSCSPGFLHIDLATPDPQG